VAQLEARLDGIEEVEGSNPFGSTNDSLESRPNLLSWLFASAILQIDSKEPPAYVLPQNCTPQQPGDTV
jgi:hypothetical protein